MPKRFSKEQSSRYKDEFSYIAPDPAKREQNYFLLSLFKSAQLGIILFNFIVI